MVIIGFSGKMGSGKNYIAESIVAPFLRKNGFQVVVIAFADQLKIDVMNKYNLSYEDVFDRKTLATRDILQLEGTENGREKRGADVWIKYVASWIAIFAARGIEHFLIPDVRFRNEAEWILSQGGIIVKINAPDRHEEHCRTKNILPDKIMHSSETELDEWDGYNLFINNRKCNIEKVANEVEFLIGFTILHSRNTAK